MDAPIIAARHITVCEFMGWPALRLQQGELRLHLVPQIGGRLMGIGYGAHELCYVNPALKGKAPFVDGADWSALCGNWSFPLWGGGKTWVAPESQWPGGAPHTDLDSGSYALISSWIEAGSMGVELESPICRSSALQIRRRIEIMPECSRWRVTQTLTNRGIGPRQCGVWDVLMLRRPATVSIPLPEPTGDSGDVVHPVVGKGPLADLYDAGVIAVDHGVLRVFCNDPVEFKVGALSEHGQVCVRVATGHGTFRYQRRSQAAGGARYAHGHPLEVFNAPELDYFEVESHSRYATLAPGESVVLVVDEQLEPVDEEPDPTFSAVA